MLSTKLSYTRHVEENNDIPFMTKQTIRRLIRQFSVSAPYRAASAPSNNVATEADHAGARQWLNTFHATSIPQNICEISFSRSSGPGGQNVNKYVLEKMLHYLPQELIVHIRVNSKATLRIPFKDLQSLVPSILHDEIRASHYYARNSASLIIQADNHRKQGDNVTACFAKLQDLFMIAGRNRVKGETSPEQIARVKRLYGIPPRGPQLD